MARKCEARSQSQPLGAEFTLTSLGAEFTLSSLGAEFLRIHNIIAKGTCSDNIS